MKKLSKKVREEAAMICAIAASTEPRRFYFDIAPEIDASNDAMSLAADALVVSNLPDTGEFPWPREHDAEAEAMLRCGWSPEPLK